MDNWMKSEKNPYEQAMKDWWDWREHHNQKYVTYGIWSKVHCNKYQRYFALIRFVQEELNIRKVFRRFNELFLEQEKEK